jgi:hypothetical protein
MSDDFDDMYGSQYLSATDVKKPVTTVIEQVEQDDFARQGERKKVKAILHLRGFKKPMILNKTNALALATAFGKNMFEDWPGKKIMVKSEPTSFGGKPTMGLRTYPEEEALPLKAPNRGKRSDDMDDELPEGL